MAMDNLYGKQNTAKAFKFKPVKESSYDIKKFSDNYRGTLTGFGTQFKEVSFVLKDYTLPTIPWIDQHFYEYRKSLPSSKNKDERMEIIYLKHKLNKVGLSLLFSQCEFSTLGSVYPFLIDLCSMLKIDIISYDYSGFGKSQGKASKENALNDIEEVVSFITNCLLIKVNDLILFGFSMGTIPTYNLSSKEKYFHLAGVVLMSAPMEAFGVNKKKAKTNDDNGLLTIECPFFIIHGKENSVTKYTDIENLSKQFVNSYEWFPRRGDQYNIISLYRNKFYRKLRFFVSYVEKERFNRQFVLNDVLIKSYADTEIQMEVIDDYIEKEKEKKECNLDESVMKTPGNHVRQSTRISTNFIRLSSRLRNSEKSTSSIVIEFDHSSLRSSIESSIKSSKHGKREPTVKQFILNFDEDVIN